MAVPRGVGERRILGWPVAAASATIRRRAWAGSALPRLSEHAFTERRSATLARTPRKWQGARNPSGLKRVRQAERRHAILQPRRSAAKTLVAKAVMVATAQPEGVDVAATLSEAISALDRAAKYGAIHPNAAARRKSRLARKINAALGGATVVSASHVAKTTGKAAAVKAAKARIAAGKAVKAKGAQTAAGKARAALSRSTRSEAAAAAVAAPATAPAAKASRAAAPKAAAKTAATATAPKAPAKAAPKAAAPKAAPKTAARATAPKAPAKAAAPKADARPRLQGRRQDRREGPGREGRPEDHEGQEARVALAPLVTPTPRSSTGASSNPRSAGLAARAVRCPPGGRYRAAARASRQMSAGRTLSSRSPARAVRCPPGGHAIGVGANARAVRCPRADAIEPQPARAVRCPPGGRYRAAAPREPSDVRRADAIGRSPARAVRCPPGGRYRAAAPREPSDVRRADAIERSPREPSDVRRADAIEPQPRAKARADVRRADAIEPQPRASRQMSAGRSMSRRPRASRQMSAGRSYRAAAAREPSDVRRADAIEPQPRASRQMSAGRTIVSNLATSVYGVDS